MSSQNHTSFGHRDYAEHPDLKTAWTAHQSLQVGKDIPKYLTDTYTWAYLTPKAIKTFDHPWVVNFILFGQALSLMKKVTSEVAALKPGAKVLQASTVYSNFSLLLADAVGAEGTYHLFDVSPVQVTSTRNKLKAHEKAQKSLGKGFPKWEIWRQDAAIPSGEVYDLVVSFMLLHEVPEDYKEKIVSALLRSVDIGGKVVFVDYHRLAWWHPLRPLMWSVWKLLEPFAFGVTERSLKSYAGNLAQDFTWTKTTSFGGLYQKVVALKIR